MEILAQSAVETSIQHRLELGRMPSGWWAVLGLVCAGCLIYGVVWLYRREARTGTPTWGRWLLGGLRITVLISLLVIWLELDLFGDLAGGLDLDPVAQQHPGPGRRRGPAADRWG